jgi:pimeloyl-ACP methyl ester carboxylesterase
VLENGLGEPSPIWGLVAPAVGRTTRVCAYDRAGQGWSDEASGPRDGLAAAADLHALLERAREPGPYVLVGHSAGGSIAMVYAARHPADVAGMVLLDSTSPHQFTLLPDYPMEHQLLRRTYSVLSSLSRLGAAQLLPASAYSSLPGPGASVFRAFATSPRNMRNARDEVSEFRSLFEQAEALTTLGGKPLVVLTASESQEDIEGWPEAQEELVALSGNSQHRIVTASHLGLLDDGDAVDSSVQAIDDVVRSVRSGRPVG